MTSEEPTVFESNTAGVRGRERGIGAAEDAGLPEREPGNPNAGGGFLELADDDESGETTFPASEEDALRRPPEH